MKYNNYCFFTSPIIIIIIPIKCQYTNKKGISRNTCTVHEMK